jgi:hypothetical protein
MQRPGRLVGGLVLALSAVASGVWPVVPGNPGVRYAGIAVAAVLGILLLLSSVEREDAAGSVDPGARLTEHPWSNDAQAWTIGEALGMALWVARKVRGKAALVLLAAPLAAFCASFAVATSGQAALSLLHLDGTRTPSLAAQVGAAVASSSGSS